VAAFVDPQLNLLGMRGSWLVSLLGTAEAIILGSVLKGGFSLSFSTELGTEEGALEDEDPALEALLRTSQHESNELARKREAVLLAERQVREAALNASRMAYAKFPAVAIVVPINAEHHCALAGNILRNALRSSYKGPIDVKVLDWSKTGPCPQLEGRNGPIGNRKLNRTLAYGHQFFNHSVLGFLGDQRNCLLASTMHPVVINMDADDVYFPDYVASVVATLIQHRRLIVAPCGNYNEAVVNSTGRITIEAKVPGDACVPKVVGWALGIAGFMVNHHRHRDDRSTAAGIAFGEPVVFQDFDRVPWMNYLANATPPTRKLACKAASGLRAGYLPSVPANEEYELFDRSCRHWARDKRLRKEMYEDCHESLLRLYPEYCHAVSRVDRTQGTLRDTPSCLGHPVTAASAIEGLDTRPLAVKTSWHGSVSRQVFQEADFADIGHVTEGSALSNVMKYHAMMDYMLLARDPTHQAGGVDSTALEARWCRSAQAADFAQGILGSTPRGVFRAVDCG